MFTRTSLISPERESHIVTPLNNDSERGFLVRPLISLAQKSAIGCEKVIPRSDSKLLDLQCGDVPILMKASTLESVRMNGGICGNRVPLVTTP